MSLASLPKMIFSDADGWLDVQRIHPTVARMLLLFVIPMSLIPPLMYAYAQFVTPGAVFPTMRPPLTGNEALLIGTVFFAIEVATVALMAAYIQELGNIAAIHPNYRDAFTLAAIAPTPLWLCALALFVPQLWFNVIAIALGWVASVALIRHGVRALFHPDDGVKARRLANFIAASGVATWICMMLFMVMVLGMVLGWR